MESDSCDWGDLEFLTGSWGVVVCGGGGVGGGGIGLGGWGSPWLLGCVPEGGLVLPHPPVVGAQLQHGAVQVPLLQRCGREVVCFRVWAWRSRFEMRALSEVLWCGAGAGLLSWVRVSRVRDLSVGRGARRLCATSRVAFSSAGRSIGRGKWGVAGSEEKVLE